MRVEIKKFMGAEFPKTGTAKLQALSKDHKRSFLE
jgi:hypothetical protein